MNNYHFEFKGKGKDLFVLILKNILLTLITVGLYYPFAKTNIRKFFWNHLEVQGEKFHYSGKGWEIFKGYALVFAGYAVFVAYQYLVKTYLPGFMPFNLILFIGLIVYFAPLVIVGSRAYLLSRTQLRGVSFGIDRCATGKIRIEMAKAVFLSIITLGIWNIIFFFRLRSIMVNNSYFGNNKFEYKAKASDFFWLNVKGILLTYVTLGIYGAWFTKDVMKFHANHTYIQGHNFDIDLKGSEVLVLYLKCLGLILVTLGLAMPWVATINMTFYVKKYRYTGEFDYSQVGQSKLEKYGAISDGIGDSLDLDLGF